MRNVRLVEGPPRDPRIIATMPTGRSIQGDPHGAWSGAQALVTSASAGSSTTISPCTFTWQAKRQPAFTSALLKKGTSRSLILPPPLTIRQRHLAHEPLPPHVEGRAKPSRWRVWNKLCPPPTSNTLPLLMVMWIRERVGPFTIHRTTSARSTMQAVVVKMMTIVRLCSGVPLPSDPPSRLNIIQYH